MDFKRVNVGKCGNLISNDRDLRELGLFYRFVSRFFR